MSDNINNLREKFAGITTAQALDAALVEANITLSAEEKDIFLQQVLLVGGRELTDEEAEQTAGGAGFKLCPYGHFEATGFANALGTSVNCNDWCEYFTRTVCPEDDTSSGFFSGLSAILCTYIERCGYFNREKKRTYTKSALIDPD